MATAEASEAKKAELEFWINKILSQLRKAGKSERWIRRFMLRKFNIKIVEAQTDEDNSKK